MALTKKHILHIIGWIVLSLLLLLTVAGFYLFFKAENYINKNLSQIVDEKTNHLYDLSFSEIELKLTPFSIYISDVSLIPDKTVSEQILKSNPGKIFYSIESPKIEMNNIDVFSLIKKQRFDCANISVLQPVFKMTGEEILRNDSIQSFDVAFHELRPLFQSFIKEINVKNIDFVDANYGFYSALGDSLQIAKANKVTVGIKNFSTDSTLIYSNLSPFRTEDIVIRMNNFQNLMGDSLHVLNIDTLEYSLKTSEINAKGFNLTYNHKNTEKNLYDVYVPRMYMRSKSVTQLSFQDSIKIQYLEFDKPQLKFYQKENAQKLEIEDLNNFNLYTLVENQFSKIEIDTFRLTNASLNIFKQPNFNNHQQQFNSVNIALNYFALDSTSSQNQNKLFHADNLEMAVSGYDLRLEDNEHEFKADSIFVSTIKNVLHVEQINILPSKNDNFNSRTVANIDCESLEIQNVNLKTLYHTRKLPTQQIEINTPNVHLQYHTQINKRKEQNDAGLLFQLVSDYMRGVYSEIVMVNNGKLNIENLENGKIIGYFETGFNFNLSGFSLDSTSIKNTDKFFYATDFDLEFNDYQMKLVDNLHKINVDHISFLSFDRKVQIDNLHLQPVLKDATDSLMQEYNRSELYDIYVPRITMQGINLRNAFFYNQLNMNNFQISNPKIYFENFGALRITQNKKEFSEFYQLAFNYLSDFNIKKIEIPDGELTWINHTKKGNTTTFDNEFSASLENFRLNEKELTKKRLFFSDNFEISVKDQTFQLSDSVHVLKAGEINLSTYKSAVSIKNALLYPLITSDKYEQLTTTFQVSIPQLEINELDFVKAFYSRELKLNNFEINSPRFQVYSKTGVAKSLDLNKYKFPLPAFIQTLSLNELKISNGEVLTYETQGLEQHARSNFKINLSLPGVELINNEQSQAQLSSQNLIANIKDFKTPLGQTHELKVGNIDFNRRNKTIDIRQLNVNPFTESEKDNRFTIYVPQMSFTGFDINTALQQNNFSFDRINIEKPEIDIGINDSIKGNKLEIAQNFDLFPYVEPFVDRINVNQLTLNNAGLNFNWFEKRQINRRINLRFNDIHIGENFATENLLNSKEFEISTTRLKTQSKNDNYEFVADSLIYNSAKHNILFTNVEINPLLSKEAYPLQTGFQTDVVQYKTSAVEIVGIDENLFLSEKILQADLLKIGKGNLDIYRNKRFPFNYKQRPPWPQDLLKEIEQPFVFDSVIILPSTIKYSELLEISEEPGYIEFNDLTLNGSKVSNMSNVISEQKYFKVNATARLFDQAPISATVNFDLTSKNHGNTLIGNLGKMSMLPINHMLEKSAPVSIESGEINRFDFNIAFNDTMAEGELYFGYDNFKISILELGFDGTRKSKLASFWANKMILNSKNPKGNSFDPQPVIYYRDPNRSIINYWWKAIFTGAKETIGIKTEKKD